MRSKTGVLVSIKIFQMLGSVACLYLHIHAYSTDAGGQHITVFCGTYMGFSLVNLAFLVSAVMGKPAAEELDMAFGVIGSCLFYCCGVMGMYFVRLAQDAEQRRTHSLKIPDAYEMNPKLFIITRAQAQISLLTALSFVYDACLKFDMWKYDLDLRTNRLKPDAFDPPDLRLFCLTPCDKCHKYIKDKRERKRADKMREKVKGKPPPRTPPPKIVIEDVSPGPMRGGIDTDTNFASVSSKRRSRGSRMLKGSTVTSVDFNDAISTDLSSLPSDMEEEIKITRTSTFPVEARRKNPSISLKKRVIPHHLEHAVIHINDVSILHEISEVKRTEPIQRPEMHFTNIREESLSPIRQGLPVPEISSSRTSLQPISPPVLPRVTIQQADESHQLDMLRHPSSSTKEICPFTSTLNVCTSSSEYESSSTDNEDFNEQEEFNRKIRETP